MQTINGIIETFKAEVIASFACTNSRSGITKASRKATKQLQANGFTVQTAGDLITGIIFVETNKAKAEAKAPTGACKDRKRDCHRS